MLQSGKYFWYVSISIEIKIICIKTFSRQKRNFTFAQVLIRYYLMSAAPLVPALGECMSADSWYSSIALSIGIRWKALMVYDLWQFKGLHKKMSKNMDHRRKIKIINYVFNFRRLIHFLPCTLEPQVISLVNNILKMSFLFQKTFLFTIEVWF